MSDLSRCCFAPAIFLFLLLGHSSASAQIMVARDDQFSLQHGQPLIVDEPGILDNDLFDEESAFEMGAVAELIVPAAHGTLVLNPNGSFSYSPGPTFDGTDTFVYAAVLDLISDQATVTLWACDGGPDVFVCWKESSFLELATQYGYYSSVESFESDAAWGSVRTPYSAPEVSNLGVRWTSNHADAPVSNPISTTSGPPRTGQWAVFDPEHGYAEGTPGQCDVDNPPESCLYHDGFSGEVVPGALPLVGVGGYLNGTYGANINIIIDDVWEYRGGNVYDHQFYGVVDTRPEGFQRFSFEEQDGKVGQALYVWGDDFTFLRTEPSVSSVAEKQARFSFAGAGPNPASGGTVWRFTLPADDEVQLDIFDARGHLVRRLATGVHNPGEHAVSWDSRNSQGREVAAGTYFGRLRVGVQGVLVRKVIILH